MLATRNILLLPFIELAYSFNMTVATRQITDIEHLGWERFFDELGRFLESSGRNYSIASEPMQNWYCNV